ncbi:MAG: glutamate formimidoyltransferase [Anaerolineae bacterium]|nr:glutamate formimidoyltransferase [Anaerolineae bacterium]
MALVECIPNFSEGRRQPVIDAIVSAIASAPVDVLDASSDVDHNRTVVTFVGEPEAVAEAAFRGIEVATREIDLTQHAGVHPRVGAADVVPFVPLRDYSVTECVALVRNLGQRVGESLSVPVFLYEEAAVHQDRRDLSYIRRGGYEGLGERIGLPEWQPDYGPSQLGTAGAAVIGVRKILIAFNAYLDTTDVQIAQAIAYKIRASGGGLPFVKAIGVMVGGVAQVSMNVVDFQQTSLYTAMRELRAAAALFGVQITRTELIGLIPQAALLDYALESLQLPLTTRSQVLEARLGSVTGDYRPLEFE